MSQSQLDWQEKEALSRYQLIAPLLQDDLDPARKVKLRDEIAQRENISNRTLYRYEEAFEEQGFSGLKPVARKTTYSSRLPENFEHLLQEAIQLKREVPKRSVRQIIHILELEGQVAPGKLKRSTLEKHLYRAGFGVKQMQMYNDARSSSSKRFCKPNRMMLIQGDIKYGPIIPCGPGGKKVQTYLSSAIDDHSRFILSSRFFDHQDGTIVQDTFHDVINHFGKFDACYFDNGSQYVDHQLKLSLAKLGITIRFAPPRSGKSKGKIEKFHQVVDSFLREAKLMKIESLEELNRFWTIFLEKAYQTDSHDGIKEYYKSLNVPMAETEISPRQEFYRDSRPLTFLDAGVVAEAFLHHETRRVDKGACISFRGTKYETKPALIGAQVEIAYDPADVSHLTVYYPGMEPFTANPVKIGSFCDKSPALPACMQAETPTTSRYLNALEKEYTKTVEKMADAISFASLRKEEASRV